MPQMAPMNWLMLFFMFMMIFLMFNCFNYFNFMKTYKNNLKSKSNLNIIWKW
uniref:ATP synthase complex subunit 8 n=1 Tax=Tychus niger TaxID=879063 RepID=A0A0M3LRP6_9COLE|nr:ATP synthase F0 subunit 8 [Tychus niger]